MFKAVNNGDVIGLDTGLVQTVMTGPSPWGYFSYDFSYASGFFPQLKVFENSAIENIRKASALSAVALKIDFYQHASNLTEPFLGDPSIPNVGDLTYSPELTNNLYSTEGTGEQESLSVSLDGFTKTFHFINNIVNNATRPDWTYLSRP